MSQSVKALLLAAIDIGTVTLNSHAVPAWLFLYTPSYSRIRLGDRMASVSVHLYRVPL